MGFPAFRLLLGASLLIVCSQWLTICRAAEQPEVGGLLAAEDQLPTDDKRFRADLGKRDVVDTENQAEPENGIGNEAEKRYSAFSGDLGKRVAFRTDLGKRFNFDLGKRYNFDLGKRLNYDLGKRFNFDLGKRFNFDLGKRFNFDLGKRSPYDHYKLDLGKREDDVSTDDSWDDVDEKRMFRTDLGKRSSPNSAVLRYPEDKRAAFRADLGKRSVDGIPSRKRRALVGYKGQSIGADDEGLDGELVGSSWNLDEIFHPDLVEAGNYLAYPDDKRSAFRADLGKRLYFKSDLGKRASFRSDLGKRASFRSDLGKRASFRSDLGKRAYFKSDLGKRAAFNADLGKRAAFNADLGKRAAFNADLGKRAIYDWKRIFRTDLGR
ncbi:hypothetical protein LSH36_729g02018 [Paralvinella palmiformis]|uniref:Uncharacterized protein n=1 Tax=Paralvinella palmiformis TaxID=53620 RepID=A0AAD9J1F2_9ANNE|nr:hypothetical protein LSH36_729g02018 [Paralvinella palmiformis]